MTPYYEDGRITIYHGDCASVLPALQPSSAALLLTDPPYSSGGLMRGDRALDPAKKYVESGSSNVALGGFSGDNRDQIGFLWWVAAWLQECGRILEPGAIAAFFSDWRQLAVSTHALQAGGMVFRGIVTWRKPATRMTQGRFAPSCEFVPWGTNGHRALDYDAPTLPGFYEASAPRNRQHITEKPVEILQSMTKIIKEDAVVLDPFAGSGTTLVAAKNMNRRAIGIEIEERYCEIAAERASQEVLFA